MELDSDDESGVAHTNPRLPNHPEGVKMKNKTARVKVVDPLTSGLPHYKKSPGVIVNFCYVTEPVGIMPAMRQLATTFVNKLPNEHM